MNVITKFDVAEYLDSDEMIDAYLDEALNDEDPNIFLWAVANVAKTRGRRQSAKDSATVREVLCKTLAPNAEPGDEQAKNT